MDNNLRKVFICFSAKDRYNIAQPIVYHLKNYGINVWYDRHEMVMGDDRIKRNIEEGAGKCRYAIIILSSNTLDSICATEEIKILELRYYEGEVVIFPVLYELKPCDIPQKFIWIRNLIFKEVTHATGTLEICNHIACKITQDMLEYCKCKSIQDIINSNLFLPKTVNSLLKQYSKIYNANLNSRVTMLYSIYIIIIESNNVKKSTLCELPTKVFERIFAETLLNLTIDYRELWLLENSMCILIEHHYSSCIESKI